MATLPPLTGKRILVTGATGMVGGPLAQALAADNTVFGGARFTNPKARGARGFGRAPRFGSTSVPPNSTRFPTTSTTC